MMRGIVRVLVTAGLAAAAPLVPGCAGGDEPSPPNVLLITVDTLRADHLDAYGDAVVDTPALDAFLDDALVFEHAFAPAPITTPSLGSILTSMMPRNHGALNNAYDLAVTVGFPVLLKQAGYQTAAFLPTFLADKDGFRRGFDVYEHPALGAPTLAGSEVVRRALAHIEAADESRPWFVWVHLIEPHSPYDPGRELEAKALERAGLANVDVDPRLRQETYGEADELTEAEVAIVRALYRGDVELTDRFLAPLLAAVQGSASPTLTVFTADHGEHFHDEHAYVGHAAWLFDSMLRVPLAFHASDGSIAPGRRTDPASLLDIAPTLFGVLDLELNSPDGGLDLLRTVAAPDRQLVHETFAPESFRDKLAIRSGADSLQRIAGDAPPIATPMPAERARSLEEALDAWVADQDDPKRYRRPELDRETRRALEAMGYAQGLEDD